MLSLRFLDIQVLQIKKRNNAWERMVKHARECCLADRSELKAYHSVEGNVVIFLNCVHDLVGVIFSGVYFSRDNFDPAKKVHSQHKYLIFGPYVEVKQVEDMIFSSQAQAYELKECVRDQLDNLPFDYVMNGNLPERVPSNTHPSLDRVILAPDESVQR